LVGFPGNTYLFEVNGVEIYMKGSNMVPLDYFPLRMFETKELEWLFLSAFAANMNVIRIWGGGMYMTD
jgi:beta-mannosidase